MQKRSHSQNHGWSRSPKRRSDPSCRDQSMKRVQSCSRARSCSRSPRSRSRWSRSRCPYIYPTRWDRRHGWGDFRQPTSEVIAGMSTPQREALGMPSTPAPGGKIEDDGGSTENVRRFSPASDHVQPWFLGSKGQDVRIIRGGPSVVVEAADTGSRHSRQEATRIPLPPAPPARRSDTSPTGATSHAANAGGSIPWSSRAPPPPPPPPSRRAFAPSDQGDSETLDVASSLKGAVAKKHGFNPMASAPPFDVSLVGAPSGFPHVMGGAALASPLPFLLPPFLAPPCPPAGTCPCPAMLLGAGLLGSGGMTTPRVDTAVAHGAYGTPENKLPDTSLPPGWTKHLSTSKQQYYYRNDLLDVTQWHPPAPEEVKPATPPGSPGRPVASRPPPGCAPVALDGSTLAKEVLPPRQPQLRKGGRCPSNNGLDSL